MIGNDIVDLGLAAVESNWKRKGYLEKIFTTAERFLIHSAKDADIMVWLLWSMKESAYKAATSDTEKRSFAPSLLFCNNLILHENKAIGTIAYKGKTYCCQSALTPSFIHTIAAESNEMLKQTTWKVESYDALNQAYKASEPCSVSHHGQYLALIYLEDFLPSASL